MTAQIGETLILNGKARNMAFCPPLPDEKFLIPTALKHVREIGPDKRLTERVYETWVDRDGITHMEEADIFIGSTACWRGYIGTWELTRGHLLLMGLRGHFRLAAPFMVAEWVTAVLRIKLGPTLQYVHMGFGSVTARELHIHIENGFETGRRLIDNRGQRHDGDRLGWENLPGNENKFAGDGVLND